MLIAKIVKKLYMKNGLGRVRTTKFIHGLRFEKSEPEKLISLGLILHGVVK